jgi:hypothetical protein
VAISPSEAVKGLLTNNIAQRHTLISVKPNARAIVGFSRPEGRGRFLVRSISPSISLSIQQLITQAPPTNPEVAATEMNAFQNPISPGARNIPKALVKITRDDKRGFVKEKRSAMRVIFLSGIAIDETKRVVIFLNSLLCGVSLQ